MQSSQINIVANDADIRTDGSPWKPIWRHETELGHDKALSVNEGRAEAANTCVDGEIPLIIFIGDGVSDLTAAREADILFARKGLKLEEYCIHNQIPYIPYETFADVKKEVQAIMKEDLEKTGGTGVPARFNPRANMWRRISSKQAVRFNISFFFFPQVSMLIVLDSKIRCCYSLQRGEDFHVARGLFRL